MVDVIAGLIAYLKADAGVAAEVGTEVYGDEVPKAANTTMPKKMIVVKFSGGRAYDSYVKTNEPRIDVLCYGANPFEAQEVRAVAHDALKGMQRTLQGTIRLFRALHDGGPVSLRDRETDWPICFESWMVLAGDEAVT